MVFEDILYYLHMEDAETRAKLREVADYLIENPPASGKIEDTTIIGLIASQDIDPRHLEKEHLDYFFNYLKDGLSKKNMYLSRTEE